MNQYGSGYSPSQLGVRPAVALSTAFLSQAFLWMFLGLLVTTGVGFLVSQMSETSLVKLSGFFLPLVFVQLGIAFGFGLAIKRISATVGVLLFFVYAAITGITLGFALLVYTTASVAAAGLSAAAVFGGAAFYGTVTKRDLTSIGAYVFMALIGLIVASFVNLLLLHSSTLSLLVSYAAVVIFTILILVLVFRPNGLLGMQRPQRA